MFLFAAANAFDVAIVLACLVFKRICASRLLKERECIGDSIVCLSSSDL